MSEYSSEVWPEELRLAEAGAKLRVTFDNSETYDFTAEFLRVQSPSAEVKGHGAGQEVTVPGKRNVLISNLEPVGNYAVRILFDDGHSTGLFSWSYLLKIGQRHDELWQSYLDKLAKEGKSRDR